MADTFEAAFTKLASGMNPMEFLLVEVAVAVRLKFLFFFRLPDVIFIEVR